MTRMDPRKILGVAQNATPEEITRAYREKSRKHHPDLGGDAWAFQQVQSAYEELTKSNGRRGSDASTQSPVQQPPTGRRRTQSSQSTGKEKQTLNKNAEKDKPPEHWWQLFNRSLPLQNETTYFILVNVLDIFMTYMLMRLGAIEANPIANYFFQLWNFNGMIAFKLVIVAIVCVIAQIVALKKIRAAWFLLTVGTIITGGVVIYSVLLYFRNFMG